MAENINIGTYELDTDKLEESLNRLQDDFIKLKKENEGYTNQLKATKQATLELTKQQLSLAESGEETSEAFEQNKKSIEQLNAAEVQLIKNQMNVSTQMGRVKQEINDTNTQLKAYMTSAGTFNTLQEAGNKALQTSVTNINQARASNTELLRVRNQLNPQIKDEAALITALNKRLDENNAFIKDNASQYEKQKINIGNYGDAIKGALGELNLFNGSLGNAEQALSKITPLFGGLKAEAQAAFDQIRGGTVATEGLSKAQAVGAVTTNVLSGAMKLLKVALISTGIGAIVVALGSLVAYLTTTQAGADKLSTALAPLKAIFSAIMGVVSELGAKLVETFSNPKKALADLGNFVKQNLINRFTAFGEILEGIINLDFRKTLDGAAQLTTGVEGLTGKIQGAASATGKFLDDAAKKGLEVDRLTKQIAKDTLEFNAAQVAVGDQLDANNLIIKDTSKSFAERAKAAEANIAISEKNGQAEAAILKLELQRLKLNQEIRGVKNLTNEDRQEEIDLIAKIDAAEDKGLEARLENSRVLAGLRKEQAEQAKKAAEDEQKAIKLRLQIAIEAQQTELDYYIQSQGVRKKSMQDQLTFEKSIMNQRIDIAKSEMNLALKEADTEIRNLKDREIAKETIRKEFRTKELEAMNEFAAAQMNISIENADRELEYFLLNNQRKIEAGQLLNETLYNQELDRINRLSEAEAAVQTERYAQGLISLEEYQLAVAQIDAEDYARKQELEAERKAQKDAVEQEERALDIVAQGEAYQYDLESNLSNFDAETVKLREAAIKRGVSEEKFDKARAENRKKIEADVNNNKLQLASDTFGNLATIFGKESAAGKAAAIAQATIDTYKSATSAFSALSGIPIVGPVLGGIAAAAAVAAGIANVKKIVSTKEPKIDTAGVKKPSYARGVIGLTGAGSGTSDSIDANLSNGESVITARATSMFPNLLSEINQIGGGVGIDGRTSSIATQNGLNQRADNSSIAEIIAEAVRVGSAEGTAIGSQQGIKDLSADRKVMADAKF